MRQRGKPANKARGGAHSGSSAPLPADIWNLIVPPISRNLNPWDARDPQITRIFDNVDKTGAGN